MLEARLYADVLLNGYYVVMNIYGWYYWLRGGVRHQGHAEAALVPVTNVPRKAWPWLVGIVVAGTAGMGFYLDNYTGADLAYPDSFTTIVSFVAMWMAARKYLQNWILWFVVDVLYVALYLIKAQSSPDLYFYAVLYAVYLLLAVAGYRAWRSSLVQAAMA